MLFHKYRSFFSQINISSCMNLSRDNFASDVDLPSKILRPPKCSPALRVRKQDPVSYCSDIISREWNRLAIVLDNSMTLQIPTLEPEKEVARKWKTLQRLISTLPTPPSLREIQPVAPFIEPSIHPHFAHGIFRREIISAEISAATSLKNGLW